MGDGSAESGGTTGAGVSNFRIGRFRNDGFYLGDSLSIARSDGYANFGGTVEAATMVSRGAVSANGTFTSNAVNPQITLNKTAAAGGDVAVLVGRQGGTDRFHLRLVNDAAETGSNTGGDFQLLAFTDAGTFLREVFYFRRSDWYASLRGASFDDLSSSDGSTLRARIEAAETSLPSATSVVTREKGDARYHPLAGTTQSYSPTVSGIGGTGATFTVNSASWRQDGKWIDWRVTLTVTATGTGNTGIRVTAPTAILANMAGSGWENSVTGNAVVARFIGGSSNIDLYYANFAAALCVSGNVVIVSGRYETT